MQSYRKILLLNIKKTISQEFASFQIAFFFLDFFFRVNGSFSDEFFENENFSLKFQEGNLSLRE